MNKSRHQEKVLLCIKVLVLLVSLFFMSDLAFAQLRSQNIDFDWYFHLGNIENAHQADFSHSRWRKLDLPHDWSIEGEYSKGNRGGGAMAFLPGGIGWYRKEIPWNEAWNDKKVTIEFDGVYMNSQVWINGHQLGTRPYGYISFSYDLTPYLRKGTNVIAVRVDNSRLPSGRWYTGSGIYRHVHLVVTNDIHVARHGTYVTTPEVSQSQATVQVETLIRNESGKKVNLAIISTILKDGKEVAQKSEKLSQVKDSISLKHTLTVKSPELWSPERPEIYRLETTIKQDQKTLDTYITPFGIRKAAYTADEGFKLNGVPMIFKGVCIHQDAGPVGVAVPEDVWYRRLMLLKEMGANAIRTSHHPFAPEFYAMCDTMGIMVMNEAFDGWYHWPDFHKAKWDYGHYFQDWWKTDLEEFIRRDRNHPSVMIWSMGNEVWGYHEHLDLQKDLYDIYKKLDPTRPVTQGWATHTHLDIAGFNANGEGKGDLATFRKEQPKRPAIGTEIPHTRQTRGFYRTQTSYNPWDQPDRSGHEASAANKEKLYPIPDLAKEEVFTGVDPRYASGYDNQTRKISARDAWKQVRDYPFYMGDFRWTGFDYLGESWGWPARTNNYGIIDLAGFPKDHYYLYQSFWLNKPMVHVIPHWNHPGKEGVEIPVVVYTNTEGAELFLNGKSLGRKQMDPEALQIVWHVPYEPGILSAVAFDGEKKIAYDTCITAGKPTQLKLSTDKEMVCANRRDVVHVEVNITDADGVFVPVANDTIEFEVSGPYKLLGVENGDILDNSPQKVLWRKAFMGKALLMIQATDEPGTLSIRAKARGLKSDQLTIIINPQINELR